MPSSELTAELRRVTKSFAGNPAVRDLSLNILPGEFLSILGPSGCGKTTTLRMLAGFIIPDSGSIFLGGQDVTRTPPHRRDVNTVFQSYGLFEHLNVADNVAFGLRRRRVARNEIVRRVGDMLNLVKLTERAHSKPRELSGGQQQRVALARALVNMPALLLLDEPLAALDLKLRREMQVELKTIQREVGITFVFVTHDQEEALTMSDRIAVMNDGCLEQVGTPNEVYDSPSSVFTARFVGTANLLRCEVCGGLIDVPGLTRMAMPPGYGPWPNGQKLLMSVRPEKLVVGKAEREGYASVRARVAEVTYLGATTQVELLAAGEVHLTALAFHPSGVRGAELNLGDEVVVGWHPSDALLLMDEASISGATK
jgi:spermidine/putrescine transport system ATP-binding protein